MPRTIRKRLKEKVKRIYVYRTRWHFLVMLLIMLPFLYLWLAYPSEQQVKLTGTLLILLALLLVFLETSRRLPLYEIGR